MESSIDEVKFSALMPEKLDVKTAKAEAFRSWHQQWKEFCQLTALEEQDEDFQISSLRSFLSDSSLEFVESGLLTAHPQSDLVHSIVSKIENYICGQSSIVHVRRSFNLRHQDEDEVFDSFLQDLLQLAKSCDFCSGCEQSLIRDRIIIGLKDADTIDKLLDEADLNLQLAIEICRAEENNLRKRSLDGDQQDKADAFDDLDLKPDPDDLMLASKTYGTRKRKRAKTFSKKSKIRKRQKIVKDSDDDGNDAFNGDDMDLNGDNVVSNDGDVSDGGPHNCEQCNYVGRTKSHLLRHEQNQHSEIKPYPCSYCDRAFGMKVRLTRHIQSVHENLKPFHCSLCSASFGRKQTLTSHVLSVHDKVRPFACDQCDARFSQGGHLNRHIQIVHENNRRFKCDICDKRCATQTDLNMHVNNNHKEIKCSICEMVFEKKTDLRFHQLTEHQFTKAHLCESCGKSYMTKCALNGHMTRAHGLPEIHCECRFCTAKATRAACQLVGEEGDFEPGLLLEDDQSKEIRRPHLCELCGKSYTQLPGLKYHMQTVHSISNKVCKCESCQAENVSPEQAIVNKHFKQPHKHRPHKCKLCSSSFTQVNSLTEHVATVHSKMKRFSCDICKATFTSHKHLGVHVRSIHLGIKPFECPHCNAKFSQLGHRNRHVGVVHEGLKKFSCDMCDKKYASKIDLKYHLKKIHGKVIMFECTLCDSKFDQRKLLMSHIYEAHQSQEQMVNGMDDAKLYK